MKSKNNKKTNILYIQTDQHRYDIAGCLGDPIIQTPTIDALAANGLRFNNAFCVTGVCTPSRGAVLTGQYPHVNGMIHNPEMQACSGPRLCDFYDHVIPHSQLLKKRGYDCINVGKWHIGARAQTSKTGLLKTHGFRGIDYPGYGYPDVSAHYMKYLKKYGVDGFTTKTAKGLNKNDMYFHEHDVSPEASLPGYLCSNAISELKKQKKSGNPFFLSINFWGPHIPVNIPKEYLYMYDWQDMPLPPNYLNISDNRPPVIEKMHRAWGGERLNEEIIKRIRAAYYGYVTLIDHQLKRVMDYLEKSGLAENTLIVFTADHGTTLGAHGLQDKGMAMCEEIYRIPLIVSGPMVEKKGAEVNELISQLDYTSTFVDYAGAKEPDIYHGSTLRPYIEGNLKHRIRKEIVLEAFGHQLPFWQRCIRDKTYKYVFNTTTHDEFYNIKDDPYEKDNLIDIVSERTLKKYQNKLLSWMEEHKDPVRGFFRKNITTKPLRF